MLVDEHQLTVHRACRVVRLSRTAFYRPPVPASRRDAPVIAALTDVVARYPRWGFWKLFDRMRAEGRPWNHKRIHRVYCALRLNLPRRTTRRVPKRVRQPLAAPPVLNRTWALDFMGDTFYDGRRVRLLTMLDEGNREALEIAIGLSLPSRRVVRELDALIAVHGCPSAIRVDKRAGIHRAALRGLVRGSSGDHPLHSAREARPECLHRTLQPDVSHGGAQRPSRRVGRRTARPDRRLAPGLQPRAAPRQPRPGTATHVSPEAFIRRTVSLSTVNLTGKLTQPLAGAAEAGRRPSRSRGSRRRLTGRHRPPPAAASSAGLASQSG